MGLSTHILDTNLGRPAANVSLTLSRLEAEAWTGIGHGSTDADGRCKTLLGDAPLEASTYRIRFATSDYYAAQNLTGLYPTQHYHIPLLLTANGYSTYRGS
jgi:5-hydroxyisourate hydrolase